MKKSIWILFTAGLSVVMMLSACTKAGNIIYVPDPDEPMASTAPIVTVIYGQDGLGDRSYNDLIYLGVEEAATEYGLRTVELSPTSYEEGRGYLENMFQTVKSNRDTIPHLYIVAAAGYDDYIRKNSSVFDSNPYADLLYLETPEPLASGGSTLYLPYYGAMYEGGALWPAISDHATLIISNPEDLTVAGAAKGFSDGFYTDYYKVEYDDSYLVPWEKHLETIYLAEHSGQGYNIADTTALRIISEASGTIVPICGGAGYTMMYLCEITNINDYMGIDVEKFSWNCDMSILKHIDRAVGLCISQWLSPEGMPKHQVLGLKDGYTGVKINPNIDDYYKPFIETYLTEEMCRKIHEDAIRKEEEYEKR